MKWLEHTNVERVVDPRVVWQLEAVSHGTHVFQDSKRTRVARTELGALARHQGLGWPMQQPKPYPITNCDVKIPMVGIVESLGILLCLKESVTNIDDEGIAILQQFIHRGRARRGWLIRYQGRRWLPINHLERHGLKG